MSCDVSVWMITSVIRCVITSLHPDVFIYASVVMRDHTKTNMTYTVFIIVASILMLWESLIINGKSWFPRFIIKQLMC